jgi:O-antigen/teichoic acid export membrane protein
LNVSSERRQRQLAFARLLSSAVISQAVLSAASFAVGLILIRHSSDLQYGSYILAANAIVLLVSLQNAWCNPPLANHLHRLDQPGRGALVGGLYRQQNRALWLGGGLGMLLVLGLWSAQWLATQTAALVLVSVAAALAVLHREYFRMVLFAYRRAHEVLRTDLLHVVLLVAGVWLATRTAAPALTALGALGLAALASALWLSGALRRHEPWHSTSAPGVMREIAPLAVWSTAGAAIHWSFSQGYIYLVAGTLDVTAVAAIAATRLLLMPVNLLSSGVGSLMLPLASRWLQQHGAALLLRRLGLFAAGLATLMLGYFGLLWLLRDWVFAVVLHKQPAQRDTLLLLWGVLFLVSVVRDQLVYLLAAQGRFRCMTLLTACSAAVALTASYWGMHRFGVAGALLGMLIGELANLAGVVLLATRKPADLQMVPA